MKFKNFTSKLIDHKVIGTDIYFEENKNSLYVRMKRSPFKIKVPTKLDVSISYLTGVIIGDGNITLIPRELSKYPRTKIKIYNSSEQFINNINYLFKEIFNYAGKLWKKKDKNCFVLEINNKIVYSYFVNIIGLKPRKKINLRVPNLIKTKKLFKYFFAGLMDTDGFYTNKTFGIMMNGTNEMFLEEIKHLSNKFHNLKFLNPVLSECRLNDKTFKRVQMNLSRYSVSGFWKIIPLKNEKWVRPDLNRGSSPNLQQSPI